jgi:hypothetical protein
MGSKIREPTTMKPKPDHQRCEVFVIPTGWRAEDAYRCKLAATHERDGHRVCRCHALMTVKRVRYVAEQVAATAGRRALERT